MPTVARTDSPRPGDSWGDPGCPLYVVCTPPDQWHASLESLHRLRSIALEKQTTSRPAATSVRKRVAVATGVAGVAAGTPALGAGAAGAGADSAAGSGSKHRRHAKPDHPLDLEAVAPGAASEGLGDRLIVFPREYAQGRTLMLES